MADRSKNKFFMSLRYQGKLSFVFSHINEFKNSNIHVFPILHDSRYYLITLSKKIWNRNHFQIRMWENTVYKIRMFWLLAFKTPAHWFSEQKIMLKFEMKIKLLDSNIVTQKRNLFSCEWLWFLERKKTNLLTTSRAI